MKYNGHIYYAPLTSKYVKLIYHQTHKNNPDPEYYIYETSKGMHPSEKNFRLCGVQVTESQIEAHIAAGNLKYIVGSPSNGGEQTIEEDPHKGMVFNAYTGRWVWL